VAVPDSATVQERASVPVPGAVTPVTLADAVRRAAADRADHPALIWADRTTTWAEFDAAVDHAAGALLELLPSPGGQPSTPAGENTGGRPARVAIALANSPDFAIALFATLRAGLVAVPVNPLFTAPELRHVLADSETALLIATDRVCDLVAGMADELPALAAVHRALPAAAHGAPPPPVAVPAVDDDLAVLLYTSGTEGHPKGAMLSHRALRANHEQVGRIEPAVVGPEDRVLLALPLFHAYGLNSGLGAVAYHGACGVLVDRFDARATLEVIARHRVSVLIGVPSMYLAWSSLSGRPPAAAAGAAGAAQSAPLDVGAAMASVRVAVCGAAPLGPDIAARFAAAAGCQVFVGYGLTETAPVLTSTLASERPKAGSVGAPVPGVELRLVNPAGEDLWRDGSPELDDEDDLDPEFLPPGSDSGEIVVRGANLFSGYWPDGRGGPDADGWWATGDIAYADADGDLFLVDRLGELILVNGFNVYPHEVELVLDAHPGVAESAVLGLPDPETGQTIRAYVVRAPGDAVTGEGLLAHCERSLARFKCPTTVEFVEALPHSAIGKVRKTMLRPVPGLPGSGVPGEPPRPRTPRE
jgi:acyl-CoA synthetase (AMP-forming)/AMP-acid ligase II